MPAPRAKNMAIWAAFLTGMGALSLALMLGFGRVAVADNEEPTYQVQREDGDIEVRIYDPMLLAVTDVSGTYDDAISAGFRRIAGFIFGDNRSQAKVAMTAPVTAEPRGGETIEMTAPVTAQSNGETWRITFMMPSEYTLETLPVPTDPRVQILQAPGRRMAVLSFSGRIMDAAPAQQIESLRQWIDAQGFTQAGPPVIAQFDAPWTPGFMRRNEVQIPLED